MFLRGILAALLVMGLDVWSKWHILKFFKVNASPYPVTDFFNLVLVWNKGISFGMFNNLVYGKYILISTTLIITSVILVWLFKTKRVFIANSLGLIIGGAFGNLWDRVNHGAVIDFLDFYYKTYHWPAFNVADSAIFLGVFMLFFDSLFITEIRDKVDEQHNEKI